MTSLGLNGCNNRLGFESSHNVYQHRLDTIDDANKMLPPVSQLPRRSPTASPPQGTGKLRGICLVERRGWFGASQRLYCNLNRNEAKPKHVEAMEDIDATFPPVSYGTRQ